MLVKLNKMERKERKCKGMEGLRLSQIARRRGGIKEEPFGLL